MAYFEMRSSQLEVILIKKMLIRISCQADSASELR